MPGIRLMLIGAGGGTGPGTSFMPIAYAVSDAGDGIDSSLEAASTPSISGRGLRSQSRFPAAVGEVCQFATAPTAVNAKSGGRLTLAEGWGKTAEVALLTQVSTCHGAPPIISVFGKVVSCAMIHHGLGLMWSFEAADQPVTTCSQVLFA